MIPEKALFIQLKMLGDIMMLTPAIKAFKNKFPGARLDIAVEPPGEELVRLNPHVDNTIVFDHRHWFSVFKQYKAIRKLREQNYDLAIDFLGNPRSAHYTFLSGAKTRIGYSDAQFQYAYSKTFNRTHCYSALSKLKFLEFLEIETSDYMPELVIDPKTVLPGELTDLSRKNLIAISPVSIRDHKVWPTENFVELVEYLYSDFNLYSVVIAGPGERGFLDTFSNLVSIPFRPMYIDNIMLLGAVLKRCGLFIGNDNGPKHIALALGLPTYTVYSNSSDPVCWDYPDKLRYRFIGGMNRPDELPIKKISIAEVKTQIAEFINDLGLIENEKMTSDKRTDS
ncbi:MAG: glycosyltransferase family 9 protein [candidate division Zixibacteria bacterium]|nr:glycosyltransferase family 9 protein [candidate division Zixibacteria bacterium]